MPLPRPCITEAGTDTADYPRALYAPHPVLSGLISRRGLARAALVLNVVDAGVLATVVAVRGWVVAAFAGAGFVLSAAYTAPPLRLKRRGLGEPSVLVVWGPLMVGGTYYAAVGRLPWAVVAASLPYALLCTSVLMGKHIDKLAWDRPAGVRTLPALLGEPAARAVTRGLMGAFYPVTAALVAAGALPATALVVYVASAACAPSGGPSGGLVRSGLPRASRCGPCGSPARLPPRPPSRGLFVIGLATDALLRA